MTTSAPPDRLAGITIRRATPGDARPTYDVFREAADHLAATNGWAPVARPAEPAVEAAITGLLTRGWRHGDGVTLVLTSARWGRWDRYVTSGADALL